MIRATAVRGQHRWTESPADTIVLDFDDRHRRRMAMTGTRGLAFLLDLETAVTLRGGDALVLQDGRLVEVIAAPEPLLEIRGRDALHLLRLAWHLGNRHLPTQITARSLRIRRDHVIAEMVTGLGGKVIEIEAPFDPEGGAYAPAHDHDADGAPHEHAGHDHADHGHAGCGCGGEAQHVHAAQQVHDGDCGHDHAHGQCGHAEHHDHAHDCRHDHGQTPHVHGAQCGHGHAHGHSHPHDHK